MKHGSGQKKDEKKLKNFINGMMEIKRNWNVDEFLVDFRMIKQPRFPKMTKNHVHQFYHACIYDKDETKKAFNRYVEVRSNFASVITHGRVFLMFELFSCERQLQIVSAFVIQCCQRFKLFITHRKSFFIGFHFHLFTDVKRESFPFLAIWLRCQILRKRAIESCRIDSKTTILRASFSGMV